MFLGSCYSVQWLGRRCRGLHRPPERGASLLDSGLGVYRVWLPLLRLGECKLMAGLDHTSR